MKLRLLLQLGAVVGALALVLLVASKDETQAGTFNPELIVTLENPQPETATNTTSNFNLPPGDVNFAAVIAYIPPQAGIVPGDKIQDGTSVGALSSDATLGLINGPCSTVIPVSFDMKDSSIDVNDTVSFFDEDGNGTADYADFDANGEYLAITKYPEFLRRTLDDPDNPAVPLQPIRRSAGITLVAGIPVLLQFLVFPPGTVLDPALPSDPALGYPSVTALQNAGDPDADPMPGAITDFCTPLTSENITFGMSESGQILGMTPTDGKMTFTVVSLGLSDADGDGFENSLDTCAFIANTGDPRIINSGDADNDGLDAACDPNDNDQNTDHDGDGYLNRQDNCPLLSNGQDTDNQNDDDLDQVGDACDPNPGQRDGERPSSTLTQEITIGTGTGTAQPPSREKCPDCYRVGEPTQPPGQQTTAPATEPPDRSPTGTPRGTPAGTPAVRESSDDDGGLSTGAIIAIVAGVAAAAALIGGGAWLIMRRRGAAGP